MSMLAVCIVLAVAGQGWEKPVIQEAELAAPVEIEQAVPSASSQEQQGAAESNTDLRTLPETSSAEGIPESTTNEYRWEYDEEGQPVMRPPGPVSESPMVAPAPPLPQQEAAPVPESRETQKRPVPSGHIATFWFVMPKP